MVLLFRRFITTRRLRHPRDGKVFIHPTSIVHPREVLKPAIRKSAAAIVVSHNHPSGAPDPSVEDVDFTKRLQRCGELVGIRLLDHVIVSGDSFVSLKERGEL